MKKRKGKKRKERRVIRAEIRHVEKEGGKGEAFGGT